MPLPLAALVVLAGVISAPDERLTDAEVRQWLQTQLRETMPRTVRQGVVIEWSRQRRSTLDPDEVDRRWEAVADFPDHPERGLLSAHRALLESPERTEGTLWFGGAAAWLLNEERGPAATPTLRLEAGGDGDTRWMRSRIGPMEQLTIIRAGVAFPSGYNVGRYLDEVKERTAMALTGGLATLSPTTQIESVDAREAPRWSASLRDPAGQAAEAFGDQDPSGTPVLRRLRVRPTDPAQPDLFEFLSDDLRADEAGDPPHASSVVVRLPRGGFEDAYRFVRVRPVPPDSIRSLAQVPELPAPPAAASDPELARVLDFRDSASSSWDGHPASERVVWTRAADGDRYLADADLNTTNPSDPPPAGALSRRQWGGTRVLAVTLVGAVVLTVPFILVWLRRGGRSLS